MLLLSLLLSMTPSLSSISMTPSSSSLLVGIRTCDWWRRGGFVVIAPLPIHQRTWALYSASHLRRGQFLHLQTQKIGRNCVSFASSPHFANPHASFWFRANSSASVGEGGVGARVEFLGGSLRSLFKHLIGWVPLLHQKHGSTHLQNRRKRGSRGGKACGRCSCCSKDERAGN